MAKTLFSSKMDANLAKDWTYTKQTTLTLPPGLYWFGDLCYVLSDSNYHSIFGKHGYASGYYNSKNECFLVNGTENGDGTYTSTDGTRYPVDAGILSIVSHSLLEMYKQDPLSCFTPVGTKKPLDLGTLYHFQEPVQCIFQKGVFACISGLLSFVVTTVYEGEQEKDKDDEEEADEEDTCPYCGEEEEEGEVCCQPRGIELGLIEEEDW